MHFHRPKLVSCKIVTSNYRTPLIEAYLHSQLWTLNFSWVGTPLSWGDLNVDIIHLIKPWYQLVAELLASFGLVDLLGHF